MTLLLIYMVLFLAIGVIDFRRTRGFDDYVVAGRRQTTPMVTFSLLASVVGASSTMGVINMGYKIGFPAFWWLGVGAIGLTLQAIWISARIKASEAYTLPDLAEKFFGREVRYAVALVVVIAWPGIVAAQFIAAAKIVATLVSYDIFWITVVTSSVIIAYSVLGGQSSILKTDFIQFGILAVAIVYLAATLYGTEPVAGMRFELINADFTGYKWFHFLFLVGGSYVICPIIFSRLFTAASPEVARKSAMIAGMSLFAVSALITLIGVWAHYNLGELAGADVLTSIITTKLPQVGAMIVIFGILSAIISSADTCLIVTASVVEHDIFGGKKVNATRLFVVITGIFAIMIALKKQDIIGTLLLAYSIFTAGIAPPMFIALVTSAKRRLNRWLVMAAILIGGGLALGSDLVGIESLALAGMAISCVLSVVAMYVPEKTTQSEYIGA